MTRQRIPRPPGRRSSFYGRDLAELHHSVFGDFARGTAPGLLGLIRDAGYRRGLVVDLGCGSGIWARELLGAGFDVLGVDISASMVRLARKTAPQARFVVGSVHRVTLPPCVAVTAIGEGVTYLNAHRRRPDMGRLFRRVHQALRPGGLFIFDAVERSESHPLRYHGEQHGADWRVLVDVVEEPRRSLLTRKIAVERTVSGRKRRIVEIHRLRTIKRAEVQAALRAAGLAVRITRSYGSTPLPPRRVAFVAREPTSSTDNPRRALSTFRHGAA